MQNGKEVDLKVKTIDLRLEKKRANHRLMIGIIASFVTFVAGLSRFWSTIEQGFKDLLSGFFAMLEGHTIVAAIASIIVVSVISIAAGVVVERIVQQLYKDQDNAYDSAIKSVERIGRSLSK